MDSGLWLVDLLTHFFGSIFEILVDGLIGSLFEWYFSTPYAIDYSIVTNLWWYVRLITAPLLAIGLFISIVKVYKGNSNGNKIASSFALALIVAATSLWIADYVTFLNNLSTDALRNPILVEAYRNEESNLEIVQEGLSDDEISFESFSPRSILKYSFGTRLDEYENQKEPEEKTNKFETNKLKNSNLYKEREETLYYIFLLKNGGAGPVACFFGMLEIVIMCLFAVIRFIVLMILIGFLGLAVTKDTFTGGNEDLIGYLGLIIRTNLVALIFNIGWIGASALSHSNELDVIHPQYWSIIVYGVVILFTYFFWLIEVVNRLIKPSIQKLAMAGGIGNGVIKSSNIKETINNVSTRLGIGGRTVGSSRNYNSKLNLDSEVQNQAMNTNNDYLGNLSDHERYYSDPEFFRNKDYDNKYCSTGGNFYDYRYSDQLGMKIKDKKDEVA